MQYAVTVIVEADTLKAAILKVPEELGEVASASPRPQQPQQQRIGSSVAGGAISGTVAPRQ